MLRPPAAGYICPCCGVEFELDDDELSHDELRRRWIASGKRWFSNATPPPPEWKAEVQLMRAGFGADLYYTLVGYTQTEVTTIGSQVEAMVAAA